MSVSLWGVLHAWCTGGEIVSASNGVGADDGAPAGADENHAAAGDEDFVPSDEEMDSNLAN